MKPGARVKLVTFDGGSMAPADTIPTENYWRLIGSLGTLVESDDERAHFTSSGPDARVCVEFDCDVQGLGLEAHNPVKNSLWLRVSDLRSIAVEPNKAPEPTTTSGTSAAEQPLVPDAVVAHL